MVFENSKYINEQRRDYSLYVLKSRSILAASDGLKAASRRILWTARNGNKYKSATLAGATMPIHPHAEASDSINTLTGPYKNNIPLLKGDGAFGTLLNPSAYGAARYTSVTISQFTKDVVFRDIEIIPMQENYDGSLQEPTHFLPLVPIALLNPNEGIAIGFASKILPRELSCIIKSQLEFLTNKKSITPVVPMFTPTNNTATAEIDGNSRWCFVGEYEIKNTSTLIITKLPYGYSHEKMIDHLSKVEEAGDIVDFVDASRDIIHITIKFKRGTLAAASHENIVKLLKLKNIITENMNVLSFDGNKVWPTNYGELIAEFTQWRLQWYVTRYERLVANIENEIQRYNDVILSIDKNVGGVAKKIKSRAELKEFLLELGVVNLDYIADLPIYRFTDDERIKIVDKVAKATITLNEYMHLLTTPDARTLVYITELKEILSNYKKRIYG